MKNSIRNMLRRSFLVCAVSVSSTALLVLAATTGPAQASVIDTGPVYVEAKVKVAPNVPLPAGLSFKPLCQGYYQELTDGTLICITPLAADDDYTDCCTVTEFGEGYHDCVPIGNTGICGAGTVYADCKIHNCD